MSSPHVNRLPFSGVLSLVDIPSDKPPSGARGRRVQLTHGAAREALAGLVGMAVDCRASWDGHDARRKIGVIVLAYLDGKAIRVEGFLYAHDFPEVVEAIRAQELGMSYELADARVEDMRQEVWKLTRVTFTGAAILLKEKAAYRLTSFKLEGE